MGNQHAPIEKAIMRPRRFKFLALDWDSVVKYFFGGNAWVAILVLALITIFLFKEGVGFIAQNAESLRVYRQAGLEYVDILRNQSDEFTDLNRELNAIRLEQAKVLFAEEKPLEEVNELLAPFDQYLSKYSDAGAPLYGLVSDLTDVAASAKEKAQVAEDIKVARRRLIKEGKQSEAEKLVVPEVNFTDEIAILRSTVDTMYPEVVEAMRTNLEAAVAAPPELPVKGSKSALEAVVKQTRKFLEEMPEIREKLAAWNPDKPVPLYVGLTSFLFGGRWLTASYWQDFYGLIPLLMGSLLVSIVALSLAVPLGVAGAVYVNQVASKWEQDFIKPSIEFIAAFPSVVLGFFGVVVLGETLREASTGSLEWIPFIGERINWETQPYAFVHSVFAWFMSWVPGFPMSERLNATTAGLLLGLMAVPTIFSLSEDAINNVPVHYKEASFALGASRLQTLVRIILPASLSGIIAAVLLGFGRVIGETMVVLLCAGNRIAVPDFTKGLGAFFEPVHTMTGIIAQEMGEVEAGGIHYRALFMVAIFLFLLALVINYFAQKIVAKFKISIG